MPADRGTATPSNSEVDDMGRWADRETDAVDTTAPCPTFSFKEWIKRLPPIVLPAAQLTRPVAVPGLRVRVFKLLSHLARHMRVSITRGPGEDLESVNLKELSKRRKIMGLFSSEKFETLKELLEHELKDLYDAEQRLTDALPKFAEKATNPSLKQAFQHHLGETEKHVERLESVFEQLGIERDRETCDAMVGLIKEGSKVLDAEGDSNVLDAALIAAAQRAEHYEIAAYGTARSFARQLGNEYVAELLQQTLDEEKAADEKLTEIAEAAVNPAAT